MNTMMKKAITCLGALTLAVGITVPSAHAKSEVQLYSIEELLNSNDFQTRLGDFQFSFGDYAIGKPLGIANVKRSTNGVTKSDKAACQWAMISALLALKEEAQNLNGIAVQAIQSTITGTDYVSATHYQCMSGHTNSRVYLKGTIVGLLEDTQSAPFEDSTFE